jgi:hypothetical protein
MKTLGLYLGLGSLFGALLGWGLKEKQQGQEQYSASFDLTLPVLDVRYASHKEGDVEWWTHCDLCKTGVIRKEDGKCSFCGK